MRKFTLWAALLVMASPLVFAAEVDEEASQWLNKMAKALKEQSYEGIFTYMRGYRFDTVKVVHRFEDGKVFERLLHLNGEQREVVRDGDDVVCRHEEGPDADLDHDVPLGPFTQAFNENLANYHSFYDFALMGRDRIAGRQAIKLSITPKNDDRYGYRLWLDEASGLLLQSHLVDRGRVREVFQFSRVEIGQPIDPSHFESAMAGNVVEHHLYPFESEPTEQAAPPQWRVAWLPTGFRQVRSQGPNRILYSDGIATLSVFVERGTAAQMGDVVTYLGGTVVITRRLKDSAQQITVVGEVPVDTAKRVAESVEPVIY